MPASQCTTFHSRRLPATGHSQLTKDHHGPRGTGVPPVSDTAKMAVPLNQELPLAHDLPVVRPDVEPGAHHVDMSRRVPIGASVLGARVAEGHVHAWDLLVLEDVPDDVVEGNVGADGELAHPVAFFIGVRVFPEFLFQLEVVAVSLDQPACLHADEERLVM